MASWRCGLCTYLYDGNVEATKWDELPDDWVCPVCGSPKSSFAPVPEASPSPPVSESTAEELILEKYQCNLCSHIYDEEKEGVRWEDLPDDWVCPVCGSPKSSFMIVARSKPTPSDSSQPSVVSKDYLGEWRRSADDFEATMADIHRIADSGHSVIEPMRTRVSTFSWDEILIRGAQLARLPLNKSQPVSARTIPVVPAC